MELRRDVHIPYPFYDSIVTIPIESKRPFFVYFKRNTQHKWDPLMGREPIPTPGVPRLLPILNCYIALEQSIMALGQESANKQPAQKQRHKKVRGSCPIINIFQTDRCDFGDFWIQKELFQSIGSIALRDSKVNELNICLTNLMSIVHFHT